MFLIALFSVIAIYQIDDVKNRDTILYAKFIANLKDKQNWEYIGQERNERMKTLMSEHMHRSI